MDFPAFIDAIEGFINMPEEYLRRVVFSVFDLNDDKEISEVDLFQLMRTI